MIGRMHLFERRHIFFSVEKLQFMCGIYNVILQAGHNMTYARSSVLYSIIYHIQENCEKCDVQARKIMNLHLFLSFISVLRMYIWLYNH